jgi:rhodanese-related sulfurtransferase
MRRMAVIAACALAGSGSLPAVAEETQVSEAVPVYEYTVSGQSYRVTRRVAEGSDLPGEGFCPPDCIQPVAPVRNIRAAGELEVLDFLSGPAAAGEGVVVDTRFPQQHADGTIPGAVNVPWATLDPQNAFRNDILVALGAVPAGGGGFDFAQAVPLVLFCDGPSSDQSVRAIRFLQEAGYPVDKLFYYRGGMRDWQMLGLSVAQAGKGSGGQP